MKKMKAVLSGQKKKVKSAVKQIEKYGNEEFAEDLKKLPRYALSTMNEIFSGLTYEQWPKVNALFQSLLDPGPDLRGRPSGGSNRENASGEGERPNRLDPFQYGRGVITGSAELKLLQKSGLLPGIMT